MGRKTGAYGEDIRTNHGVVANVLQDRLLFFGERDFQGWGGSVFRFAGLPVEYIFYVPCSFNQGSYILPDQLVATCRCRIPDSSGHGQYIPVVRGGQSGRDQRSPFACRFNNEGGIGQSCDNPVAAKE